MSNNPKLDEKDLQYAREWRILKCGSPRFEDLFKEFGKKCEKAHKCILSQKISPLLNKERDLEI